MPARQKKPAKAQSSASASSSTTRQQPAVETPAAAPMAALPEAGDDTPMLHALTMAMHGDHGATVDPYPEDVTFENVAMRDSGGDTMQDRFRTEGRASGHAIGTTGAADCNADLGLDQATDETWVRHKLADDFTPTPQGIAPSRNIAGAQHAGGAAASAITPEGQVFTQGTRAPRLPYGDPNKVEMVGASVASKVPQSATSNDPKHAMMKNVLARGPAMRGVNQAIANGPQTPVAASNEADLATQDEESTSAFDRLLAGTGFDDYQGI